VCCPSLLPQSSQYTLTYFDIRGLAELPRLVLAASGAEWKDDRIPFSRNADGSFDRGDWEERKKHTPYGQVPVLVLADGTQLAQSAAIIRFISSRHGLSGKGDVEAALVDAGLEHISDVRRNFFSAKSDAAKVAAFWESGLAASLAHLEKNVASDLYFAKSGQLTYTDIALYYLRFVLLTENADAVNKAFATTPKLLKIAEAVEKEPKIAAYLAQRKQTPM